MLNLGRGVNMGDGWETKRKVISAELNTVVLPRLERMTDID